MSEDPQNPIVLNFAARISLWSGDSAGAVEYARQAVQLQPDSPEDISTLGLAEYYNAQFAAAASELRRALEIIPDSPPLRVYLRASTVALARTAAARPKLYSVGSLSTALRDLRHVRTQSDVLAQLDWQSDYRFRPLKQRYPELAAEFVTYR